MKERRRELRHRQTDSERVLWNVLRGKHFHGLKFFRQYSVGPYILDFYCPAEKLAIELDGNQHLESDAIIYDAERTAFLKSEHVRVIRYWSNDVIRNIEGVAEDISRNLKMNGRSRNSS